ncbi:substrate-binding periplasmic protein [Vibrio sp. TRT 17S01]|uniref:substrate-binding periplasmic protein n=1 Tax=Vibrio sp. TRT 17S01 TaxID=3418505 RepID=UPI003CF3DE82
MNPMLLSSTAIISVLSFMSSAYAHERDDGTIHLCGDAVDWPPYTYTDKGQVLGVDVDILRNIFDKHDIRYDVSMTSWTRCLRGVEQGMYDIALSATFAKEREQKYLYTDWYYDITPVYVFSRMNHPKGIELKSPSDLNNYVVCGIFGYNYRDFNLDDIQQYANSIYQGLNAVRQKQCDVFISWKEIHQGFQKIWNISIIGDEFEERNVPNMDKHRFYMMISQTRADKEQLRELINKEIARLKRSGEIENIISRHTSP